MKNNYKSNLLIGFGTSLIILMVSSVASYYSIKNLLTSSDLVNHTQTVMQEMEKLNTAVLDAETGQRGYLLTGNETFLEPYDDSRARAMDAYARLRSLTEDNIEQQEILPSLNKFMIARFNQFDATIENKRNGIPTSEKTLLSGKVNMDNIRDILQTMKDNEIELLEVRTGDLKKFAGFTPPLIVIAACLALLITTLFYLRTRNDFAQRLLLQTALEKKDAEITNRVAIIQEISSKISAGDYTIRVNDEQQDALGGISGSLNKMAQSLQYSFNVLSDKEWVQTGLASFNDALVGEKDTDKLSEDILAFLASYTGSHVGVIYLLEDDELRATKGYALEAAHWKKVIRKNEGLLGQSIASGKVMELKDVPADSITISFATGQIRPNHVVAVPFFSDHVLKGAIELATVEKYPP